jgi:hypothetical protein
MGIPPVMHCPPCAHLPSISATLTSPTLNVESPAQYMCGAVTLCRCSLHSTAPFFFSWTPTLWKEQKKKRGHARECTIDVLTCFLGSEREAEIRVPVSHSSNGPPRLLS